VTFLSTPVHVSVPATSANLGPGYDCLGLALEWRDELVAHVSGTGLQITVDGENADGVPRDGSHLVVQAMDQGFRAMGLVTPGLTLHCHNSVPHARGLGSSASAIVGGLCLARGLVAEESVRLTDPQILELAADMEGHPDNVAAALWGGLVISGERSSDELEVNRFGVLPTRYFAHHAAVHADLVAVAFVPDFEVETKVARGLLPEMISHRAASQNASRVALLVAAAGNDPELLHTATRDFLHQDYRDPAMPETLHLVRRLRSRGVAAVVSGAGPTVLALVRAEFAGDVLALSPTGWAARVLGIDQGGARTTYA
jgi:homoserine kinase